jgi:hypothetical protein
LVWTFQPRRPALPGKAAVYSRESCSSRSGGESNHAKCGVGIVDLGNQQLVLIPIEQSRALGRAKKLYAGADRLQAAIDKLKRACRA